jgi:hypothetical protein
MNIDKKKWDELNEALVDLLVCGFVTSSEESRIGARLDRARRKIEESPGTDNQQPQYKICPTCKGSKSVTRYAFDSFGELCPTCIGTGKLRAVQVKDAIVALTAQLQLPPRERDWNEVGRVRDLLRQQHQ